MTNEVSSLRSPFNTVMTEEMRAVSDYFSAFLERNTTASVIDFAEVDLSLMRFVTSPGSRFRKREMLLGTSFLSSTIPVKPRSSFSLRPGFPFERER